jgi:hypothetical protein
LSNNHFCWTFTPILVASIYHFCFSSSPPCKPLTVCEALAQIDRIRGQVVTIQGLVWLSSHGVTMTSEADCRGLPPDRQNWVSRIAIDSPDDFIVREERIPAFDGDGFRQLARALEQSGGECTVILTGEIRFRPDVRFRVIDGKVVGGSGYGQMGRLPAQLAVRDFLGTIPNEEPAEEKDRGEKLGSDQVGPGRPEGGIEAYALE